MRCRAVLAAVFVALLLLSACSSVSPPEAVDSSPAPQPAGDAGATDAAVITFAAPEDDRARFEPLIERFNSENSDLQVRFVPLDGTINPRVSDRARLEQELLKLAGAADTLLVAAPAPAAQASALLADLVPLLDADATFERADLAPAALPASAQELRILPLRLQPPLLAFNRDLLEQRGLSLPGPDTTWAELLAIAQQVARSRNGTVETYGLLNGSADSSAVSALLGELQEGGTQLLGVDAQASLDQVPVVAALEGTLSQVQSGALVPPPGAAGAPSSALIEAGQAGLWPADALTRSASPPFALGLAPFPAGAAPAPLISEGLAISAGSQNPAAAWRWLSFLSRQQIPRSGLEAAITDVPARNSLLSSDPAWRQLDADQQAALKVALARPAASP